MSSAQRKTVPKRISVAEYLSGPTDDFKSELIDGELIVPPAPSEGHQDLAHNLGELLGRWTRAFDLGKVSFDIDMVLDVRRALVYRPDVLFVAKEHFDRRREGRLYGPADLCVEILSPSDRPRVQRRKYEDYAKYGVAWYWTVLATPDNTLIEENELHRGSYRLRSEIEGDNWFSPELFPGLHLRVPPLREGNFKAAVRGKAKRLV